MRATNLLVLSVLLAACSSDDPADTDTASDTASDTDASEVVDCGGCPTGTTPTCNGSCVWPDRRRADEWAGRPAQASGATSGAGTCSHTAA